ncbi:MAG: thiamine diphosphokinase [Armatimonadetes bacterium]|nr:thiamine diphosphokinase [Armatimonadota bacterium]
MIRVVIVLGGNAPAPERLAVWAEAADVLIGADSGADAVIQAGLEPVVIGDLDSTQLNHNGRRVIQIDDQDTTDLEKSLKWLNGQHENAEICVAGSEGNRLDHVLNSLSTLSRRGAPTWLLMESGVGLLAGTVTKVWPTEGTVSIIPFHQTVISASGLRWPLVRSELVLGGMTSISNEIIAPGEFTIHSGTALIQWQNDFCPW